MQRHTQKDKIDMMIGMTGSNIINLENNLYNVGIIKLDPKLNLIKIYYNIEICTKKNNITKQRLANGIRNNGSYSKDGYIYIKQCDEFKDILSNNIKIKGVSEINSEISSNAKIGRFDLDMNLIETFDSIELAEKRCKRISLDSQIIKNGAYCKNGFIYKKLK